MNWVHPKFQWGTLIIKNKKDTLKFDNPVSLTQISGIQVQSIYEASGLLLTVKRQLTPKNTFIETYTIKNKTAATVILPKGTVEFAVPFHDSYEGGAAIALKERCNAHIWAMGSSAYVNGIRMSGKALGLGLILTQGSLGGYSLNGATFSNDRGRISLNLETITLQPGQIYKLEWELFWHNGWDDFWNQALKHHGFVKMEADKYTVVRGESINISAVSALPFGKVGLQQNGKSIPFKITGDRLIAKVQTKDLGEQVFELVHDNRRELLITNVVEDPMTLIKARVNFIINKQQRNEPGSKLDGAYLIYDNETKKQFWSEKNDKNEARERVGMGVLLALYLPYCKDIALKEKLVASLKRFETFIGREIQDSTGVVYNASRYKDSHRIYNSPWVAHFHLAMYQATKNVRYLQLFSKTVIAYYGLYKGHNYEVYPIGWQISDGLKALKDAGSETEYREVFACFEKHATNIAEMKGNYPVSEVAYEQSIVAPGVQIELEMYLITKDPKFLKSAQEQIVYLDAFNGQQPDYHLNDMAIRHWDDYWFGKLHQYGDTFPHYWQTITAIAFDEYADALGDAHYRERAKQILMNNLCLFHADGSASCAYVYPLNSMGARGQQFDLWANDQDWALVNLLTIYNRGHFTKNN